MLFGRQLVFLQFKGALQATSVDNVTSSAMHSALGVLRGLSPIPILVNQGNRLTKAANLDIMILSNVW